LARACCRRRSLRERAGVAGTDLWVVVVVVVLSKEDEESSASSAAMDSPSSTGSSREASSGLGFLAVRFRRRLRRGSARRVRLGDRCITLNARWKREFPTAEIPRVSLHLRSHGSNSFPDSRDHRRSALSDSDSKRINKSLYTPTTCFHAPSFTVAPASRWAFHRARSAAMKLSAPSSSPNVGCGSRSRSSRSESS
jgi:hypothetical protein